MQLYLLLLTLLQVILGLVDNKPSCHEHTHSHTDTHSNKIYAVSILQQDNDSGVHGVVKLIQDNDKTTIVAKVYGLSDGKHGFHIHEFGNLIRGCITAGPHYNPHQKDHGGPHESIRHIGDLGNIHSNDGVAIFHLVDNLVKLNGEFSVIGRSMVVHANEDDLGKTDHKESKTTGNAGARLACGVIGISGPFELDE